MTELFQVNYHFIIHEVSDLLYLRVKQSMHGSTRTYIYIYFTKMNILLLNANQIQSTEYYLD